MEVVRAWTDEVWHKGAWGRVPEFVGPEYTRHEPDGTRLVTAEEYSRELATRSPQVRFEADIFGEGDIAVAIWCVRRSDQPAMSGVQIYRVADGKLVETWLSAVALVEWPVVPSHPRREEPGKDVLRRWYEEMYAQRRFELAPELCGPEFIRHEADGTFTVTAEEHAERLRGYFKDRPKAAEVFPYRAYAWGDKVGVIGLATAGGYVQAWRLRDGRFVESWFAGFSNVPW